MIASFGAVESMDNMIYSNSLACSCLSQSWHASQHKIHKHPVRNRRLKIMSQLETNEIPLQGPSISAIFGHLLGRMVDGSLPNRSPIDSFDSFGFLVQSNGDFWCIVLSHWNNSMCYSSPEKMKMLPVWWSLLYFELLITHLDMFLDYIRIYKYLIIFTYIYSICISKLNNIESYWVGSTQACIIRWVSATLCRSIQHCFSRCRIWSMWGGRHSSGSQVAPNIPWRMFVSVDCHPKKWQMLDNTLVKKFASSTIQHYASSIFCCCVSAPWMRTNMN